MNIIGTSSVLAAACSAAMLLAVQSGCSDASVAQQPAPRTESSAVLERVTAGPPLRKSLARTTVQPSRIQAFEETPVYAKVTGYAEEVLVDIGDRVKKGQVLLKLWVPEMQDDLKQKQALLRQAQAEVRQAQAAVRAAEAAARTAAAQVEEAEAGILRTKAEIERWKAEHARVSQLAGSGSVTRKLVDETASQLAAAEAAREEAIARVESAKAALNQSQAKVESAKADEVAAVARQGVAEANLGRVETLLAYTQLHAPYDGIVTRRNVDTGHYVQPPSGESTPLFVLCRADVVRVFMDVPELEAAMVDKGDTVTIAVQALGGKEVQGTVTRTSWDLDPANRSLRVEIDVANEDLSLRPGMFATVSLLLDQRSEALVLPVGAIVRDGRDTYCCQVVSGRIERTPIQLGLRSGNEVEVVSGLRGDETVVLARADGLKEGQPVEVLK